MRMKDEMIERLKEKLREYHGLLQAKQTDHTDADTIRALEESLRVSREVSPLAHLCSSVM